MKFNLGCYTLCACVLMMLPLKAQQVFNTDDKIYDVSAEKIYPYILGASGFYLAGQVIRRNADGPTVEDIMALDKQNVWSFDRGAIKNNSERLAMVSDYLLYSSFSIPILCYLDKGIRKEGSAMAVMLFEGILIADGITNVLKGSTKRYRPFAYNTDVPVDDRLKANVRFSFISGHTSISAAMSFLSARVLTDLHPHSKWNKFIWALAIVTPVTVGLFRYQAGRHFPTDIIGGYAVGMGIGLLIPSLHKKRNVNVGISGNGVGLTIALK